MTVATRFREIFYEVISERSPMLEVRDDQLQWKSYSRSHSGQSSGSLDLGTGDAERAAASVFVEAVNSALPEAVPDLALADRPWETSEFLKRRAARIASNVEGFASVLFLAGIGGGAWVAWQKQSQCTGQFSCEDRHPFIGLGVGIAVASAFQAAVVVMVATYIQARMSDQRED